MKSALSHIESNDLQLCHSCNAGFQHFIQTLLPVAFVLDQNAVIINVSGQQLCEVLGYESEELIGSRYIDFIVNDDKENAAQYLDKTLSEKTVKSIYHGWRKKDGSSISILVLTQWDSTTKLFYCMVANLPDVKVASGEDGELNISSYEMLERITDSFIVLDKEWRFVYANPKAEQLANTTFEQVKSKTLWDCFPYTKGTLFEYHYRKAVEEQVTVSFEAYYPAPLNMWMEVNAYPSSKGLSVFFRDISERKQIEVQKAGYEQRIEAQNEMFTNFLERITDAFYAVDNEWNIIYYNQQAENLTGFPREQMVSRNLWECFPKSVGTIIEFNLKKAMEDQRPVYFEANSTVRPILLEISAYPSPNGLTVFYRDITEKRKTEKELEMLSLLAKETTNAMSAVELDGTISWINKAYTDITGFTPEDAIGRLNSELLSGEETDKELLSHIRNEFYNGKPFKSELLCYTKDKKPIWLESSGQIIRDEKGNVQRFLIIHTDITERKKSEAELRKLSLIAEQTINAVVISDADRNIVWINKSCERLSGFTLEEAVGKSLNQVFDGPLTDPEKIEYTQRCFENREPFQIEVLNYKKNGDVYWADVACQPLFNEQGEFQYFFSISTDITERKKLEEELQSQRKETTAAVIAAQEKERALVGQELHDNVNQVLTTVKLYTELCRDGVGDVKELMDKSVRLLQDSINEIRSLSKRLSAPSLGNIKVKESVAELIDSVMATNKVCIYLDTTSVEGLEIDNDLHIALYRILQEHLTNILKHADAKSVQIILGLENGKLSLQVTDDGKGFDSSKRRNGIGLTNMMLRAESMKGELSVKSAPGMGCELRVDFPLG